MSLLREYIRLLGEKQVRDQKKKRVLYHIGPRPAKPMPMSRPYAQSWRRYWLDQGVESGVFFSPNPIDIAQYHGISGDVYAYKIPEWVIAKAGGIHRYDHGSEVLISADVWQEAGDEIEFLGKSMPEKELWEKIESLGAEPLRRSAGSRPGWMSDDEWEKASMNKTTQSHISGLRSTKHLKNAIRMMKPNERDEALTAFETIDVLRKKDYEIIDMIKSYMNESSLRGYIRELVESQLEEPQRVPLDIPIPADLKDIHKRMKYAGRELFLVGGAVRDTLLGKSPKDYDVATNASPEEVIKILQKDSRLRLDLTGKQFGVVRVKTPDDGEYEIATFREDIGKGKNTSVKFSTIENDVNRRDLTINALFYDMDSGEVVDYVGGIKDIEDGIIRAVGNPADRFDEDKLRILRAVRFAGRMGSDLDHATKEAILEDNELTDVTADRITEEFVKGIKSAQDPTHFLSLMQELNLFEQVLPGLNIKLSTQGSTDHKAQIAALLVGNPVGDVSGQLKKMRYSNDEIKTIKFLLQMLLMNKDTAASLKNSFKRQSINSEHLYNFAKLVDGLPPARVDQFLAFAGAPPAGNPKELMAQGLKGPEIGHAMAAAEAEAYVQIVGEVRRYVRGILKEFNLGAGTGIEYTAFILSPATAAALNRYVPKGWIPKSHHMTLISPRYQKQRLPSHWLDFADNKGQMKIVGIAQNDKVVTGLVDLGGLPVPMKGPSFPHVTIAVSPKGGKPAMSNEFQLSDFEPISPIPLNGKVEEILR